MSRLHFLRNVARYSALRNDIEGAVEEQTWRHNPATEKQKAYANFLGIEYPPNITKGELSDLISQVTGE